MSGNQRLCHMHHEQLCGIPNLLDVAIVAIAKDEGNGTRQSTEYIFWSIEIASISTAAYIPCHTVRDNTPREIR